MSESTMGMKEPTLVGLAEAHLSEEEEEDIFHDVTEPSVPGQEVFQNRLLTYLDWIY